MAGDEATETVAEPSVSMTEVAWVLTDIAVDLVDPAAISSPRVEVAAGNTPVLEVDAETQSVHTGLPVNVSGEIVDESPSHDLQKVMEGGVESGEVLPIPSVRELVSEDPSPIKVVPAEGNSLSSFFFLFFIIF